MRLEKSTRVLNNRERRGPERRRVGYSGRVKEREGAIGLLSNWSHYLDRIPYGDDGSSTSRSGSVRAFSTPPSIFRLLADHRL